MIPQSSKFCLSTRPVFKSFPTCRSDHRCRHARMSVQHLSITPRCILSCCSLLVFYHQTSLLIDLNSAELRYELLRNVPNVQRLCNCTSTCAITQQPRISWRAEQLSVFKNYTYP